MYEINSRLLTAVEAAKYLGLSVSTLDRMRKAGHISRFEVGTTKRYELGELNRFINDNQVRRIEA